MNFYTIETNDKFFRITWTDYRFSLLELDRTSVNNVRQNGLVIIAEKGKDLYDLYLPSNYISNDMCPLLNSQFYLVASNISDYLVYEDLLVFKASESCYKFLYIPNFIIASAEECYLSKRLKQLPSISCHKGDSRGIRCDFDAISHINKDYNVRFFVFRIGNEDYLISIDIYDVVPLCDSGIKITPLGIATSLQWNGLFFKSMDNNGNEYWHEYFLFTKEGPYAKIEEMQKEDYPSIYRPEAFTGYLKKDKDGFICVVTFVLKSTPVSYSIHLESPVKELKFVKTFEEKSLFDNQKMDFPTELWQVKTSQDENFWLLVFHNRRTYTMIPNEIFEKN